MTVPKVMSPVIDLHVCHPPPLWQQRRSRMEVVLKTQLTQPCDLLHPVATRMSFQFPETRLIQYDCGEQALIAFMVFVIVFMTCAFHIWNCKMIVSPNHNCCTREVFIFDALQCSDNLPGAGHL